MRKVGRFIYLIAMCFGLVGPFKLLPTPKTVRRWRNRRLLMRAFLHAAADGQLRAEFFRLESSIGRGFLDSFTGTAGALPFCLTRLFRPFRDTEGYHLFLGHGDAFDGSGREMFYAEIKTSKDGGHPFVGIYRALRKKYPMVEPDSEAS
ncbi:MAG: hypothetical protein AAB554_01790 [Patescibacteria group bacterium]